MRALTRSGVVVAGGAVLHALSPKCNPSQLQNGDVDIFLYGMNETQARHPRERLAHHSVLRHTIPSLR